MTIRRRSHPTFLTFAALILLPATAARAAEKTVRVGSWNIEWLGMPEKRSIDKVARKPEDVAKYVKASGVAVLGLNEITFNEGAPEKRTNKTLTRAFALLKNQTGDEWDYVLFPLLEPNDPVMHTGVAWNKSKVKMIGQPFVIPVRRSEKWAGIWNRSPRAVKFSTGEGKTDLVVIPIHAKSNSGGFQRTHVQRGEEAKTLVRSLGAIQNHFKDDDVVIIGDFNTLFGNETSMQRFRSAGFFDLNFKSHNTWIKSDRFDDAPFDRVLVPDDQPEFRSSTFTVFKGHPFASEKQFRRSLSDHYLIYADVKIMNDDD